MRKSKYRIGILGIGAVGGYFGGKLASRYRRSEDVEIIFLARGANAEAIRANGLKTITPTTESIVHPSMISSDPKEIGKLDFILCTLKAYDLVNGINQYKDCIQKDTIFLPLLNGVTATEKIKSIYPDNEVWEGFAYVVVRLIAPGIVHETGIVHSIYFGSPTAQEEKLNFILSLFADAGIDVYLSKDILKDKWEKFIFISTMATATSSLNLTIGEILADENSKEQWLALIREVVQLAHAKNIAISPDTIEKCLKRASALPPATTSSMHNDFKNKKPAELDELTAYVLREGKNLNVPTPTYEMMYQTLQAMH